MSERVKKCDNCKKELQHGDKVTAIVPNVEVNGRYIKNGGGFHLKLSKDALESRSVKIYCENCLKVDHHIKLDKDE
jgi:hypothetical protein